ncbi:hypothetical protein F5878DRAFT_647518 [Lentinula raphanica]|uniref:Uncharacterized protein n=1 Tax=Lentinula raphanica TaxID=153919 RepID=A0AA38NVU6_9AGAR|nr:hypothetical protein F5878DRAFT_647518 [Lentinula raphanica]
MIQLNLVPLMNKLATRIPFQIPTLFHLKVRNYFSIRKTLDCRDLAGNDNYFERFFQRTATPLPRLSSFWQALLNASSGTGASLFSLHYMTRSYLSSSFEDSDSEDERLQVSTQSSSLPIFVQNYDSRQGVDVLYSTFSYAKAAEGKKAPFPKGNRQSWTEKYRQQAEKGIIIDNLEDLAIGMRERFYDDHEVTGTPGTFKNSQKWLRVSNTLINSREICLLDSDAKLICYSNGTLSSLERGRLLTALMLFFNMEPGGVKLISRNASGRTHNMFTTFHFSTWGRYGQNAKAAKASEKEDFSDEEANDRASSPPITSDVEVDEDEEEFNNIYGEEHTPEEQPLEHLEDGQEEEDHALEGFQDMEVDVDTPDNGIDLVKTPTKAFTPFSSPSKRVSVQAAVAQTKLRHQLNVSPSRTYSRPSPDKRKVYKVTSNMFSPRTRKLAVAGKRHARRVSTIEDAFPSDKHAFFLDIAQQTAVVESLVDVFESVKEDTDQGSSRVPDESYL